MLFNSIDFAIFLPIVFALYWGLQNVSFKLQKWVILLASYFFYGSWDWRFLTLIIFSTLVDFSVGRRLENEEKQIVRKLLLWLSILINLGLLGFFKYYNFFVESFASAFTLFGQNIDANRLNIVLPVGISFYTFQTLSYTIDVYRKDIKPCHDLLSFSSYVAFFPQLVAGPIERATRLLPQFYTPKIFNYTEAVDGMRQILWGLFKKVVIADNCARMANYVFENYGMYTGWTLLAGAVFFAIQIYGDFSGYSDIAIGTSRLFGFRLMKNFAFPYFSRDIAEFWRRWHISLSTWFRDYLYVPLGGSRGGKWTTVRNVFIIFLVSGFWHGANWTFLAWGGLNALYFLPILLLGKNRKNLNDVSEGKVLATLSDFIAILTTFGLIVIAWIFFRSESITMALKYIYQIGMGVFDLNSIYSALQIMSNKLEVYVFIMIASFVAIEWLGRESEHALERFGLNWSWPFRRGFYLLIAICIFLFGQKQAEFIYFQF